MVKPIITYVTLPDMLRAIFFRFTVVEKGGGPDPLDPPLDPPLGLFLELSFSKSGGVHDSYTFQCGLVGSFTSHGIDTR